ncbi:hypothetical protein TIFTF001_022205 [Ficus carica]|uniref:Uncharacterized protein n=1 Tax=Ficus carica TaxID=3494 RepID=A0AA88DEB5_FICCA|nr:hypothetical protein TIFTF001_022205 [Ficus carica]
MGSWGAPLMGSADGMLAGGSRKRVVDGWGSTLCPDLLKRKGKEKQRKHMGCSLPSVANEGCGINSA